MKRTSLQFFYLPAAFLILCSAGSLFGQEKERSNDNLLPQKPDVTVVFGPDSSPASGGSSVFRKAEFSFEKFVKGAPYSAQAVTQSTQTLSDGNRITNESSIAVYRDSKGRTRREILAGGSGAGAQPERITINDPATGDAYDLDPATRTATRNHVMRLAVTLQAALDREGAGPEATGEVAVSRDKVPMPAQNFGFARVAPDEVKLTPFGDKSSPDGVAIAPRSESLGTQIIDGVEARGSRSTITIPAGKIGNERAIEIVNESWYSPELQTVVMSRLSDPRSGEVVYRLKNINRAEPDSSLFEVPGDYKIRQDSGEPFSLEPDGGKPGVVHRTRPAKPPELEP